MMLETFGSKIVRWQTILAISVVLSLAISTQSYLLSKNDDPAKPQNMHYRNYTVFQHSSFNFIEGNDLYGPNSGEYKYSPSFAVLFVSLAFLPDFLGLTIWNFLNVLILLLAISRLPLHAFRKNFLLLLFILFELITAVQNSQSNGLIAGLIIFSFLQLSKDRVWQAAVFVSLAAAIKVFAIVAFVLFLFPKLKWNRALVGTACIAGVAALPLLYISPKELYELHRSWVQALAADRDTNIGYSVAGWLKTWFAWQPNRNVILVSGIVLFVTPLFRLSQYKNQRYQMLYLASVLIWVVIFNFRAESPTYVIAMCGVGIWLFSQPLNKVNIALAILAFIFTSLSVTDLSPPVFKKEIVGPYAIKAVPCIIIWLKLLYDQWTFQPGSWDTKKAEEVEMFG